MIKSSNNTSRRWAGALVLLPLVMAASQFGCKHDDAKPEAPVASTELVSLPEITVQPQQEAVQAASRATFSVVAKGEDLVYQWKKNGVDIPEANGPSYTTQPVTTRDDNSSYMVAISNSAGTVLSEPAYLQVTEVLAPAITMQPMDMVVLPNRSVTFRVLATGSGTLRYQWKKNGIDIPGANSDRYVTPKATISDDGESFMVVITSEYGTVLSDPATLSVQSALAPRINSQPENALVISPAPATFKVAVENSLGCTYQWKRNGLDIEGANGPSYTVPSTRESDSGSTYMVQIENEDGFVLSRAAVLTVQTACPLISSQPSDVTVMAGRTATFKVSVGDAYSDLSSVTYQWKKNGIDIPGAMADSYITPVVSALDDGSTYMVLVRNGLGMSLSEPATLSVISTPQNFAPTITSFTSSLSSVAYGQNTVLRWQVSNADSITIDQGVGSVSGNGYAIVRPSYTKTYTLTARNAYGTITAFVTVTVQ